jgi:hypothetical protein
MIRGGTLQRATRRAAHYAREGLYYGRVAALGLVSNVTRRGTPIYDRDWDAMVVLDACRPDMLAAAEPDYDFLADGRETRSVASYSKNWMRWNFSRRYAREMAETVYVTANPFSGEVLDGEDFAHLEEVWRYDWDRTEGTVLPRPVTDRAIEHARERDPERLIVHYMQPHHPFLGDDTEGFAPGAFPDPKTADPWDQVRWGQRDAEAVLDAYRENLRHALEDVDLLLENIDADRVVITADHGNAVGERGIYGHPAYAGIDAIRRVPWYVTSTTDAGTYHPQAVETRSRSGTPGTEVNARLSQLGYV